MSYAYTGEVLLPVRITPPANLRPGDAFPLRVTAAWLVCEVECIPEEATLAVSLPVTAGPTAADPHWGPSIERVLCGASAPPLAGHDHCDDRHRHGACGGSRASCRPHR
jgi:DsbC/DsbD-like thiol-disulfide interchange protein